LGNEDSIWTRLDEIVGDARSVADLRHHGVELIAAWSLRQRGLPVPDELRADERSAVIKALGVPSLLSLARDAYDGALVLMKGPEVAAHYPAPEVRPFCDLDFLVDDPDAAHRQMVAAGFLEVGDPARYDGAHHLRPLALPGLPLFIELHREVNRPVWLGPPDRGELLELTQPSATGIAGVLAPVPAAHAVLLALHSWAHAPLRRLLDLVDVAVVLEHDQDRQLACELARRWRLERVWRTTIAAADALLGNGASTSAVRIWARHLAAVRERTVFETHLATWAGPMCGLPRTRARAVGRATRILTDAARPRGGERWADAIRRTRLAIANAPRPQSEHDLIKEGKHSR
jgi:hypothetical protein